MAVDRHYLNMTYTNALQANGGIPLAIPFIRGFEEIDTLLGCVGSMISTVVLFIPLDLTIAKQLKADRKFAVGLVILGSATGFMTSPITP